MLTYADVFQMLKKATQNKEVRYAKEIAAITAKTHKSGVHATIQSRLQLLFDTGEQAATLALCSQHTSAYVSIRQRMLTYADVCCSLTLVSSQRLLLFARSIRQHTSAYVSVC
jgi:hypothetical protein